MSDYWTENGLIKPQAVVVCAACRLESGVILCGARHWDSVMVEQARALGHTTSPKHEDGFINQFGEFLTREEAMKVVRESGQPFNAARNVSDVILFSEGLY